MRKHAAKPILIPLFGLLTCGGLGGCAQDETTFDLDRVTASWQPQHEERAAVCARVFGTCEDPERVLSTVAEQPIPQWLLAQYLVYEPALSIEDALSDLENFVRLASSEQADSGTEYLRYSLDAAAQRAWMRHLGEGAEVERIDEYLEEPATASMLRSIELLQVSHLLIKRVEESDELPPHARERMTEVLNNIRAGESQGVVELLEGFDFLQSSGDFPEELFKVERHLVFSDTWQAEQTWLGINGVDPAFSAAAAALEVGACSDVVESSFGLHIICREQNGESEAPYGHFTERHRALLGLEELARLQNGEALMRLIDSANIQSVPEGMQWLTMSDAERLSVEVAIQRSSILE